MEIRMMDLNQCKKLLDNMRDILRMYEEVTVADLKELLYRSSVYTDHRKGWRDLCGARIEKNEKHIHLYTLILPKPINLE